MSTFHVTVRRIAAIERHDNADVLELAVIDDFRSIVRKGAHQAGDLVAYIPEAAVLPEGVLKRLGLWNEAQNKGNCAGELGNRVKAVRLRGKLSQGVVYPLQWEPDWVPGKQPHEHREGHWRLDTPDGRTFKVCEGATVEEILGITKFKPEIPAELSGQVFDGGIEFLPNFDVDDIKTYPGVFREGEEVAMHEKLHGTFTGVMLVPAHLAGLGMSRVLVFSKGLAQEGLAFQLVPEEEANVYVKAHYRFNLEAKLDTLAALLASRGRAKDQPVFIFGEVLGSASKQDLKYGADMDFRVFDMGFGGRSSLTYLDDREVDEYTQALALKRVPLVYRGPFSKQALAQHTTGKETYSGKQLHIREGVVVRPCKERRDDACGRVLLKSVSPDYLVRTNGTEFQ